MAKRIKNTTGSNILHINSGISFPTGGAYTVVDGETRLVDDQTYSLLNSGAFVFNDGGTDYTSPALAWAALAGEFVAQQDEEKAQLVRLKAAPKGWTYQYRAGDMPTSKGNSLINMDSEGADPGDALLRFFSGSELLGYTEITGGNLNQPYLDANCTKTILEVEPVYDYELIGGEGKMKVKPTNPVRLDVVAVPDIPYNLGGSRRMIRGANFQYIADSERFQTDGRASKRMNYSPVYHSNKLQFHFRHNAGEQHDFFFAMEHFRA